MCEIYKCETNIIQPDCGYKIQYFLTTEDDLNFGFKSILYKQHTLTSTDVVDLMMSQDEAERVINTLCENHVFPQTYLDVLADMDIYLPACEVQ